MRKITIITGASSGMGAEFARQIARETESTELWLFARNKEKLNKLKIEIGKLKTGNSAETKTEISETLKNVSGEPLEIKCVPMNLAGKEGVARFKTFLATEKLSGEYEIAMLVNNAGFGTYGEFSETPLDRELEMIDLNCTALTGICGSALPYLHEGARIINVASLAAFLPLGNFAVYAATKAFVLSFSVALSAELTDKKIRVSALCPGSVSTDFANVASNGARKEVLHGKDPVAVVAHCLKSAKKGKRIILWSFKWKFTAFMSRFIGRYLGARYTFKYNKRPSEWK
ncbi:MAG: SDR family NAD(P)-dependent oxidoreductase [Treponema sp.]|nr:SDR family NAD(P)-dependent oxidoreductase [Treponema sp.]